MCIGTFMSQSLADSYSNVQPQERFDATKFGLIGLCFGLLCGILLARVSVDVWKGESFPKGVNPTGIGVM